MQTLVRDVFEHDNPEQRAQCVRELVEGGETENIEFKETFQYDVKTKEPSFIVRKEVLVTIAGFLNRSGPQSTVSGVVLIGVADDKTIRGISPDLTLVPGKTTDKFQSKIRNLIKTSYGDDGLDLDEAIKMRVVQVEQVEVLVIACPTWETPVWLKAKIPREYGAPRPEFYTRQGQATQKRDGGEITRYTRRHYPRPPLTAPGTNIEALSAAVSNDSKSSVSANVETMLPGALDDVSSMAHQMQSATVEIGKAVGLVRANYTKQAPSLPIEEAVELLKENPDVVEKEFSSTKLPIWLRVLRRRVIGEFLTRLKSGIGLEKLYVVSPWLSEINDVTSPTFDAFLRRLKNDHTTAYIVTRPPTDDYHESAIERIGETGRANIAYLPNLHAKLYIANTKSRSFAMLGSANFTKHSFMLHEIAMLIEGIGDGRQIVRHLQREAAALYRTPERTIQYQARL